MFNSTALEVGIGLIFIFLIFSLILTATAEMLESFLKNRAVDLQRALKELLGSEQARQELMNHGMLFGLYQGGSSIPTDAELEKGKLKYNVAHIPSYIPKDSFAKALIDLLSDPPLTSAFTDTATPTSLKTAFSAMQRQTRGDAALLQVEVERWYDATMDRASSWFKRRTQWTLFAIGLIAAVALNINAVSIARHLEARPEARAAVIVAASAAAKAGATVPAATLEAIGADLERLQAAALPMGWGDLDSFDTAFRAAWASAGGLVPLVLGWLIMAAAGTLGGPFWFDLLGKVMQVRTALKPADSPAGQADAVPHSGRGGVDTLASPANRRRDPSTVDAR